MALNYNFSDAGAFTLYRRKDDRQFRFCRYNGKDYKEFVDYLQAGNSSISIPPADKLRLDRIYTINGKGKFEEVDVHIMPSVLAMNSAMVLHDIYIPLLVNFAVAKYVLSNYPDYTFRTVPEMNCHIRKVYNSVESLESISEDSFLRKYQVFLPIKRSYPVNVKSIPDDVFLSYINSEVFTQEYVPFTLGKFVGLRAWGIKEIIPAKYKDIKLTNFVAYLQNEDGLWAEFGLVKERFHSSFLYGNVKVEPSKGLVVAMLGEKEVILHSSNSKSSITIDSDEAGHVGVRNYDKWIITPEYDWVSLCEETGYYEVFKEGFYGLYSPSGTCILPCAYELIEGFGSQPELFKVCNDLKWGIVGLGGKCYHSLDIPHNDKEKLEKAYHEAVLTYLREAYDQHRILPTSVLKINTSCDYILVELRTCNLRIKVYKKHLPEGVFDMCVYGYMKTTELFGEMVLYVTEGGQVRFNFEQTQKWKKYQKNLKSFKVGNYVCGEVRGKQAENYTVRFSNGVYGTLIPAENKIYSVKERVNMRVDRIEGDRLFLSQVIDSDNSESNQK